MALIESLLTAIVRADGDALVMHVGEKPYVVASAGPIELSSQGLNLQAMAGMVAQLLPAELQRALTEFGAVEHELPSVPAMHGDRFTVVVARGGDDVWIEIRRHRRSSAETSPLESSGPVEVPPATDAPGLEASMKPAAEAVHDVRVANHSPAEPIRGDVTTLGYQAVGTDESAIELQVMDHAAAGEATTRESADVEAERLPQPAAPSVAAFESEAMQLEAAEPAASAEQEFEMGESSESTTAWKTGAAPATANEPMAVTEQSTAADAIAATDASEASEPAPEPMVTESTAAAYSTAAPEPSAASEPPARHVLETLEPLAGMHTDAPIPPAPPPEAPIASSSSAAVIPMTRTLRIEVPRAAPPRQPVARSEIERLLGLAAARGASALYLTTQAPPFLRVDDDVQALEGEPPMASTEVESAVLELMPETTRDAARRGDPTEWVSELPEIGRVRCATFRDYRGPGAIFQLTSFRPVGAEQLGLNHEIRALATETEGLVLVASPRGHGKSTLLGAFVDLINHQRSGYVITLERQIRLVHEYDRALISQREVRGPADQVLNVARAALSENADVLVIDDLPSAEVFQLALDAAGSGRLVFVAVTAPSVTAALIRVVELFPSDQRKEVLSLLGERLRGAVAQVLLRKTAGGRIAAREVVLATSAVARVLADGQLQELPLAIDSGRKYGLVSLTDSLVQLVRGGVIDAREAYRKADDRQALLLALKRENVDTSLVERLA